MSSGRKHLLDLGYTVPTIERHTIYIMSHLVGQSTQRIFNQIWLGSYLKPERECLISKLTSKRNIILIFGVPFAKREDEIFDHLFACNSDVFYPTNIQSTHLTSIFTKSHCQNLKELENSSVDTPDIWRKYRELLILSCHLMMMLE